MAIVPYGLILELKSKVSLRQGAGFATSSDWMLVFPGLTENVRVWSPFPFQEAPDSLQGNFLVDQRISLYYAAITHGKGKFRGALVQRKMRCAH